MAVARVEVIEKRYTVEVYSQDDSVASFEVNRPSPVNVIMVGTQGPPGPSGAGFVFTQNSPAMEWIVNHNLGFKPSVEIFDTGGNSVEAQVLHMSVNQARVYFNIAKAGEARCV